MPHATPNPAGEADPSTQTPTRRREDLILAESDKTEGEMILVLARNRATKDQLPYAGAVTPREAFRLTELGAARIIDVRTPAENYFVGRINGSVLVPWQLEMPGDQDVSFLEKIAAVAKPSDTLLLLCRSAKRSHSAAIVLAQAGWSRAFNILEGFEGEINAVKRRGTMGGWRFHGLPWEQN
jgi:rhodanese-related sulfurtransferase